MKWMWTENSLQFELTGYVDLTDNFLFTCKFVYGWQARHNPTKPGIMWKKEVNTLKNCLRRMVAIWIGSTLISSKAGIDIPLSNTSITVMSAEHILSQYLHLYHFRRETYAKRDSF